MLGGVKMAKLTPAEFKDYLAHYSEFRNIEHYKAYITSYNAKSYDEARKKEITEINQLLKEGKL